MSDRLNKLREQILAVDMKLIELIAQRQNLASAIGQYKKQYNLPIYDAEREAQLKQYHQKLCHGKQLSSSVVEHIFKIIIEESRKVQQ